MNSEEKSKGNSKAFVLNRWAGKASLVIVLALAALALLAGCGQSAEPSVADSTAVPPTATPLITTTPASATDEDTDTEVAIFEDVEKVTPVEEPSAAPTPTPIVVLSAASTDPSNASQPRHEGEAERAHEPGAGDADSAEAEPTLEPTAAPTPETDPGPRTESSVPQGWSPLYTSLEGCQEKDVVFADSPIDVDHISAVEPQGELTGFFAGHITPGDHVGFQYDPAAPARNVYALADGYLKRVERQPSPQGFGITADVKNYHLYFEYSCSLFGSYVHVTELDPAVATADPELNELNSGPHPQNTTSLWPNIAVKAGQIIGEVEAFGLLGMLTVDTAVTLPGFVTPSRYDGEPWKVHSVPPFDYFVGPLRDQILGKNPRTQEPIGGKIDFDVDGTLAGNWFLNGANFSDHTDKGYCGDYYCPYWNTHLAFVYDFVNPDQVRVSIGYDSGLYPQGPYGLKANSPNPATVSVDSGRVMLELVDLENRDAEFGITTFGKPLVTLSTDSVVGVMLVELLDERSVKMEIIPGVTAAQDPSFSEAATVYQR